MMSRGYCSETPCPVCRATDIAVCMELSQVPVHCNLLWPTREEALGAPSGTIRLGFCGDCGHLFNLVFNPGLMEYRPDYENSLHFSPRFQSYATSLATRLVGRYDLYDKKIIEIGCGKGEFLILLCEQGGNRGIGFDPSYGHNPTGKEALEGVVVIQDFYSERYAHYKADLICCRQVLEHIHNPIDFLTMLRRAIGNRHNTVVFFEVPNGLLTLRDLAIWDLIYEHCSYFSSSSLARLFAGCGFDVCHLSETFADQFLCIEALPGSGSADVATHAQEGLDEMAAAVQTFAERYRRKVEAWRCELARLEQARKQAVVWGAGSKGVTFLNTLKIQEQIEYVVDINPRKQGTYIPGTGQQIVPPEFLRNYQPDIVMVMNAIYESEIRQLIKNSGVTAELVCP